MIIATAMSSPTIELTDEESEKLARAITNVTEQYEMPILDPRSRAWMYLGLVGFELYGSRAIAAWAERSKHKPQPVTPMKHQPHQAHPNPQAQPITPIDAYAEGTVINATS